MPCRWSRRCSSAAGPEVDVGNMLPSPSSSPNVDSWMKVRKGYLRSMRKQTRCILLLLAMIEALKHGPMELVYAGRDGFAAPGEQDYGLAYTVGYIFSYIYVCIFMIVFVPLFSWWVPATSTNPEKPDLTMKVATFLKKVNMILLPISIGACGVSYLISAVQCFIYVDARTANSCRMPKNTRKNWTVRALMLCGVAIMVMFSHTALHVLDMTHLARVKDVEFYLVLVPIQVNMGTLLGSLFQHLMEKRIARREANKPAGTQVVVLDEKAPLIET